MRKQNYKISLAGRIIIIISAIFSIVLVSGEWLDLYQVPLIFGNGIPHEYTLYEIADFLEIFDMYLGNSDVAFYADFFSSGANIVIIINIVLIILALANVKAARGVAGVSVVGSIVIAVVYLSAINIINAKMEEATYGGIEQLLRSTSKPYWLIGFSVLSVIGSGIKRVGVNNNVVQNSYELMRKEKCTRCGVEIISGSSFCGECGARLVAHNHNEFCTNCGTKMEKNAIFCVVCGHRNDDVI